jgi:dihydroneopterin aldolase
MSDAGKNGASNVTVRQSTITLRDLRLRAYHGVLPQERVVGGDYSVTLCVSCDVSRAVVTDRVEDTLDYSVLCNIVRRQMAVPSALLEHVAGRIGSAVFRQFPQVSAVDVEVTKCNPPIGVQCGGASVSLHLINNKTNG